MKVLPGLALRRLVLLGAPLSLAVLMLFHPSPYSDVAGELIPAADWWLFLHAAQFVLFALTGWAVFFLMAGLRGVAATVGRWAAVIFVVFYDAGDAIAGLAIGILARAAGNLPAGERAAFAEAIRVIFDDPTKNLFFAVGIYGWILALVAAAVALYRAGAPRPPLVLLALSPFFITFDHARPFGSLTFGSFFLVALWLEIVRGPSSGRRPVQAHTEEP